MGDYEQFPYWRKSPEMRLPEYNQVKQANSKKSNIEASIRRMNRDNDKWTNWEKKSILLKEDISEALNVMEHLQTDEKSITTHFYTKIEEFNKIVKDFNKIKIDHDNIWESVKNDFERIKQIWSRIVSNKARYIHYDTTAHLQPLETRYLYPPGDKQYGKNRLPQMITRSSANNDQNNNIPIGMHYNEYFNHLNGALQTDPRNYKRHGNVYGSKSLSQIHTNNTRGEQGTPFHTRLFFPAGGNNHDWDDIRCGKAYIDDRLQKNSMSNNMLNEHDSYYYIMNFELNNTHQRLSPHVILQNDGAYKQWTNSSEAISFYPNQTQAEVETRLQGALNNYARGVDYVIGPPVPVPTVPGGPAASAAAAAAAANAEINDGTIYYIPPPLVKQWRSKIYHIETLIRQLVTPDNTSNKTIHYFAKTNKKFMTIYKKIEKLKKLVDITTKTLRSMTNPVRPQQMGSVRIQQYDRLDPEERRIDDHNRRQDRKNFEENSIKPTDSWFNKLLKKSFMTGNKNNKISNKSSNKSSDENNLESKHKHFNNKLNTQISKTKNIEELKSEIKFAKEYSELLKKKKAKDRLVRAKDQESKFKFVQLWANRYPRNKMYIDETVVDMMYTTSYWDLKLLERDFKELKELKESYNLIPDILKKQDKFLERYKDKKNREKYKNIRNQAFQNIFGKNEEYELEPKYNYKGKKGINKMNNVIILLIALGVTQLLILLQSVFQYKQYQYLSVIDYLNIEDGFNNRHIMALTIGIAAWSFVGLFGLLIVYSGNELFGPIPTHYLKLSLGMWLSLLPIIMVIGTLLYTTLNPSFFLENKQNDNNEVSIV